LIEGYVHHYISKEITVLANTRKSTEIWEVEEHIVGRTS